MSVLQSFIDELEKISARRYVYYGLTSEEANSESLKYKFNRKYSGKGVNTTLRGLRKFVKDHGVDEVTHYARIPLSKFKVMGEVYPDSEYEMLTVKAPFSLDLNRYKPRSL